VVVHSCVLGCQILSTGKQSLTFQGTLLPSSSGSGSSIEFSWTTWSWRRRHYDPSEGR